MSAPATKLAGQFFLTFDDQGFLQYHGEILGSPERGFYLCQRFDGMGQPNCQVVRTVREMSAWQLYDDLNSWKRALESHLARLRK